MIPPRQFKKPNWQWTSRGLVVAHLGKRVFIPLHIVVSILEQELAANGIPAGAMEVGSCSSVGGLFGKIRKGVTKAKVVPKFARKALSGKLARSLTSAADRVSSVAKNVVTHPAFRAGFGAVAVAFPVLAPAAVGLEVAARVIQKVEAGQAAAKQIAAGVKSAGNIAKAKEGARAQRAIQRTYQRAQTGDTRAQRAAGGIVGAKVASRAAKRYAIKKSQFPWMIGR